MVERILVPAERIEHTILVLRGRKVLLDSDLVAPYAVPVKALNRAVKRNIARFPADFMFQLTDDEVDLLRRHFGTSNADGAESLRSQFVISNLDEPHSRSQSVTLNGHCEGQPTHRLPQEGIVMTNLRGLGYGG